MLALALALLAVPAGATGQPPDEPGGEGGPSDASESSTAGLWTPVDDGPSVQRWREQAIRPDESRAFTLDHGGMRSALADAPAESTGAAGDGLEVAVPAPDGGFERFTLRESPIMEPGLADDHPDITTYSGRGIDDPAATIRADLTPLGFHASVRSPRGSWYVDPAYVDDPSSYLVYFGRDLTHNPHGTFVEHGDGGIAAVEEHLGGLADTIDESTGAAQSTGAGADATTRLRTYRLALLSDPTYADYFGAANVTAAKVTLMNRVNQIYEDESAIRLVLVDANDTVNLDTDAAMTGANGPCGDEPCYTPAQASGCSGQTLNRTRIVMGQLIGASNYDIGHIIFGLSGGGIAGLRVVGGDGKARGCTGLPHPIGDYFAVDYVAHEMGHQFGANHTFNGNQGACSGRNRNGATSVEPGSGSSIMAYAGICVQDDLQPHTDPYWSQRSFAEIAAYTSDDRPAIDEVQTISLRGFDRDADSFTLTFDRFQSPRVIRGHNYTAAGIEEAVESIRDWPEDATVEVRGWDGSDTVDDSGFRVTFGGSLAGTDVESLRLRGRGVDGFTGETATGGPIDNQGWEVADTGNHVPDVDPVAPVTIPYRTPFALTGSASDADGDTLTYLWEQNDTGTTAVRLLDPVKTSGPLFRVFGTALDQEVYDPREYDSPGSNTVSTDPTRVFPDMAQIVAGHTNAKTGDCPGTPPPPPATVPLEIVDCYSEFLPTPAYGDAMSFRVTVRDGNPGAGGVASQDTTVSLAEGTGPFLVTSQSEETTYPGASTQTVTWDVAGTDAPPVDTSHVRITLSTDGGFSYPHELAASTPNDGRAEVTLPNLSTDSARIKVEAVDNVYFAINDADITILPAPEASHDAPGTVSVQYSDELAPVTVTASDADTAGSALSAEASGLPKGLSLTAGPVSDDPVPDDQASWTVAGTVTDRPGSYPVTVEVSDDTGGVGTAAFTVEVEPEDAAATYVGDTLSSGPVRLRAVVRDGSVLAGAEDSSPGDIRAATVSFLDGTTTVCGPVPVRLLGSSQTAGSASCEADLPGGTTSVDVVVGGSYVSDPSAASVTVSEVGRSMVTGGAQLPLVESAGAFAADPGAQAARVRVNARYRNGVVGKLDLTYVSGGTEHRLEATSLESLGVEGPAAEIRGSARLVAVDTGAVVATDATVHAALVDNGSPGRADTAAITVWGSDGSVLLSSRWAEDHTAHRHLSGGNLRVHPR